MIFAAGTGNPYFSTDTTAALRAMEIKAEIIMKATKVDGIYDADPVKSLDAKKIARISYIDVIKRKLRVMDTTPSPSVWITNCQLSFSTSGIAAYQARDPGRTDRFIVQ